MRQRPQICGRCFRIVFGKSSGTDAGLVIICCISYFVPKIRSPASPRPGQMYALLFSSRSRCPI